MPRKRLFLWLGALAVMVCGGCANTPSEYDYAAYRDHMPRSILVLPPLNESVEVDAPYSYLTTVSSSLAEFGYYVFPVSVIDAFMKDNGLPTPGEMHEVPLDKIAEIIGPDAVFYITIVEWGQKYLVISSETVVEVRGQLVDVASGATIWTGHQRIVKNSSGSSGSLVATLITAAITQIADTVSDAGRPLAFQANALMFGNQYNGLLIGPRHPGFATAGAQ